MTGPRTRRSRVLLATAQLLVLLVLLAPIVWLYVSAFRTNLDIHSGRLLPQTLTLAAFRALLSDPAILRSFLNSFVVSISSALITTVSAALAAYSLSRFRYRGRGLVGGVVVAAQLIPGVLVLVPLIVALRSLGLANSLGGLVVAHLTLGLPIAVFLLRSYIDDLPPALEDAALVDGCNRVMALWRVVLPLLRPAVVAVGAFAFILSWGEYLIALSLTTSENVKTLPLMIQTLFELHTVDLSQVMALGVLISLPVALLFSLVQKHLIGNLTAGGVK